MFYVAAVVSLLLAVGAWISVTAPFIRNNNEDAEPQYAGFLIEIFYHLYLAFVIGFSYKKRIPVGVYAHAALLAAAIAFGIMGGLSD
ncbi:MAG: hypothetical protein QNJ07_05680 [Woeseiaceae bacterium]|nr:hypothetical protein [Woeseiaceae bacterium]